MAGLSMMLCGWLVLAALFGAFVPPHRRAAWGVLASRSQRIHHRHRHGRDRCPSAPISDRLYRLGRMAARHRCVYGIGCYGGIQLDHYRPWSLGGFTALANLMGLCALHNRVKSNYWPGRHYKPMEGADDITLAHAIWAAERRARRSPLRWALVLLLSL